MGRILMIDDDQDDQFFYQGIFEEVSPEISFNGVSSKEELDDLLESKFINDHELPDLILLDLNLPKVSGKEIFTFLSNNTQLKNIPVVALTTSSSPLDMKECRLLGFSAYFIKPSEYKDCKKLVEVLYLYWFVFNVINQF